MQSCPRILDTRPKPVEHELERYLSCCNWGNWSDDHESRPATVVLNSVRADVDRESSPVFPLVRPGSSVAVDYVMGDILLESRNLFCGPQFFSRHPDHFFARVAIQSAGRSISVENAQRFHIQYPEWHRTGFQQAAVSFRVVLSYGRGHGHKVRTRVLWNSGP